MKWLTRVQRFVRGVFGVEPPPVRRSTPRPRQPRPIYTGRDSGTRERILKILSDGRARTRQMIAAELDVTTASIHLPRMVDDGLIVGEYLGRRKWYRLVESLQPLADTTIAKDGAEQDVPGYPNVGGAETHTQD